MTEKEYKKAWGNFKKALMANGDPLHLKGCMYMNATQVLNHTATIDLGCIEITKENAENKAVAITTSEAFKNLSEVIGIKSVSYEFKENAYYHMQMYMRINY